MTTQAKSTKGTTIGIGNGDGPPETFDEIAEVTNFAMPGITVQSIEVTHLKSTAIERIAGLADGDTVQFDVNFIASDAQQQELFTLAGAGTKKNFRISLNDHLTTPTSATFEAFVQNLPGPGGGPNEAVKISGITLQVSGPVTRVFAPA